MFPRTSATSLPKRLACGLAVVALVAVGCSDESSETSTPDRSGPADTTTETTPAALERYADYTPEQYAGTDNWLCHPDADDLCDDDLDATEVKADGSIRELPWTADPDAPIDCFYVYPTISRDAGLNSDLDTSPDQEGYAARNQVARLGEQCRVFAPVYQQVTLAGIGGAATPEARDTAYGDVLDAWKSYMAEANDGRGVVLIGDSQGSSLLKRLIAEEIDPNDDVRERLVSAYLPGAAVNVPEGQDVGGDFDNVAPCSSPEDTGCFLSWASYRSTAPPPDNAIFGRTAEDAMRAACINPAALSAGLSSGSAELSGFFPANRGGTILAGSDGAPPDPTVENSWVDPEVAVVDTPYVTLPGLTSGECTGDDRTDWLEVTVNGDPADPRADDIGGDLSPEWGLHLLDLSLVMGDIQALVTAQTKAYVQ